MTNLLKIANLFFQALQDANLTPVTFIHKDALALVNAFSFSDSLASCVLYQSTTAALLTQITVAMSLEALCGKTESFHPIIHKCLPHSGQIEVAENILRLSQVLIEISETDLAKHCTPAIIYLAYTNFICIVKTIFINFFLYQPLQTILHLKVRQTKFVCVISITVSICISQSQKRIQLLHYCSSQEFC